MGLNREERKLLHQKSKQPTFGNGKPDSNQGNEGDIAYRQVEDSGLVQYVKQNGSWVAVGSQGDMPETRDVTRTPSGGGGVGNHNHGEFIKKDGSVAYTGNQSFGTNNITNVGTLDVDGATTLDQVTINTTDGAFAVSGANPISLTTTGGNKIILTSSNSNIDINANATLDVGATDVDIEATGEFKLDSRTVDLDTEGSYVADVGAYTLNSGTLVTTGSANMTIQATGTAANFLLLKNTNQHASSFTGINIETNSGGAANVFNNIVINCDNIATKGGSDYGVTIRSENGIVIEAADANASNNFTQIKMVANGGIDIGANTSLSPASHSPAIRTLIHGKLEIQTLYKASGSIDCSTHSVKFDQLDTLKLMRSYTHIAKGDDIPEGSGDSNKVDIISNSILASEGVGTVYQVTIGIDVGDGANLRQGCLSVLCSRLASTTWFVTILGSNTNNLSGVGAVTASNANGMRWHNTDTGYDSNEIYITAQRIAESSHYP